MKTEQSSTNSHIPAPTAASLLAEGDKQNRYLTLPDSRVVINPFDFESKSRETTQVQYSNRPTMPLNMGYCDPFMGEGRGMELPNLLMMAEKLPDSGETGVQTIWQANLKDAASWFFSGVQGKDYDVDFRGGSAVFRVLKSSDVHWQHMQSAVTLDMEDAYLSITVNSVTPGNGRISVKVNDGENHDVGLIETNVPGCYTFNLQQATRWTGRKTINVCIFGVNLGAEIVFSDLKIQKGVRAYADARDYTTSWRPDFLGFKASYPGGTRIDGKDFLYDEQTAVRDMQVTGNRGFMVYGEYNGAASVHGRTVVVNRGSFQYAVTLSADAAPVFYANTVEALAGGEGTAEPADRAYGVWAYHLNALPESGVLRAAVAFETKLASAEETAALSQKPGDDCHGKLKERTAQWDDLLSRVPRPGTFELTGIDTRGVTAEDVKQSYYEAWVQIIGNALPANPEIGYPHRSFATGKPSLWGYGSPKCSYSATWESLYGMSYYAQIDPDAAWDMYRGLMSLVDEKGQIAGESLPPNNARVAWILYTVKPDMEALAEVQPWLTRHLDWRYDNPRWIYLDVTPDTMKKDMDFVAPALIDVRYLMRINKELGLESQNAHWEERIRELYANMQEWFFPEELEYPVECFTLDGGKRSSGYALWTTKALHIPDIRPAETQALLRLFRSRYDTRMPFCGIGGTKYEPYNYTQLGLFEHGCPEEGRMMLQTAVRDILLTGIHAEGYYFDPAVGVPLPEGVRPSMFGVCMIIDDVYMLNGVRMDDGMPVFSNYFRCGGSLENYTVLGEDFRFCKEGDTYTWDGKTMEVGADQLDFPFPETQVHPFR